MSFACDKYTDSIGRVNSGRLVFLRIGGIIFPPQKPGSICHRAGFWLGVKVANHSNLTRVGKGCGKKLSFALSFCDGRKIESARGKLSVEVVVYAQHNFVPLSE